MAYTKIKARKNSKNPFQAIVEVPGEQWEFIDRIETYASSFIGGQPIRSIPDYKRNDSGDLDLYITFPSTVETHEFITTLNTNLYGIPR